MSNKSFDCRYLASENRWVVISPVELALPHETLLLVASRVRVRWEKEAAQLNPITDGTKLDFIRQALKALDANRVSQVFIKAKGDIPLFTSTEGTGAIYG